jgi:hypothetical protein
MSPKARSYHRRDRREVGIAAAVATAIIAFTVFMIWALGPHPHHAAEPTTTTEKVTATTTSTTTSPTTTTAG